MLQSEPFYKEQYQKLKFVRGSNFIEFFVNIHDHENEKYEYEYIDFNIEAEIQQDVDQTKFYFCLKYFSLEDEGNDKLIGDYKYTENFGNEIDYGLLSDAKYVCRSIYIPSLRKVIKIGSYPDSLEVFDVDQIIQPMDGGLIVF